MTAAAPSLSPGTRDDLAGGASLAAAAPFFGSAGAARRFVDLAVLPRLAGLAAGRPVACVDVGGGEGILAAALAEAAGEAGIACDICVLDQNPLYLAEAERRGLRTLRGDACAVPPASTDLALLRFVNHYASAAAQSALAGGLARLLRPGGLLAAQIQTAAPATCALLDEIAGLLSGDLPGTGRHWPTLPEFRALLASAGFEDIAVIGAGIEDRAPAAGLVEEAWTRVHGRALRAALTRGDAAAAAGLLAARERFRDEAHAALGRAGAAEAVATTQPIVVARRSGGPPSRSGRAQEGLPS